MSRSWYRSKLKLLAVSLLTICFSLTAFPLTDCSGFPAGKTQKTGTERAWGQHGAQASDSPEDAASPCSYQGSDSASPGSYQGNDSDSASLAGLQELRDALSSGSRGLDTPAIPEPSSKIGGGNPVQPVLTAQPSNQFPQSLESVTGLFTYYNQTDERWANERFGPKDPILTHGCGPTVLAMLVSSYTSAKLDPLAAAAWAADNGYCIPGDGSSHAIIEGGCTAFGLSATSISQHTPEAILQALESGRVVVALMGNGYFTDSGHFIVILKALDNGMVRIADPYNLDNCRLDWPVDFLISQLKSKAYSGGPLWAVGNQE